MHVQQAPAAALPVRATRVRLVHGPAVAVAPGVARVGPRGRRQELRDLDEAETALLERLGSEGVVLAADRPPADPLVRLLLDDGLLAAVPHLPGPAPLSGEARLARRAEVDALLARGQARDAAEVLRRRADAVVGLSATGPVAEAVALLLASAGVGTLVGRGVPRDGSRAAADVFLSGAQVRRDGGLPRLPDVTLLLGGPEDSALAGALTASGAAHLPVLVDAAGALVGPAVLPGTPCTRCRQRARVRADPALARPEVARVELVPDVDDRPVPVVTATAAAAATAGEVLAVLDGGDDDPLPVTCGAVLDLVPPDPRWRRRPFPADPSCACGAATTWPDVADG